MLACAALIGFLCVPQHYVHVTREAAMYYAVDAQGNRLPEAFDPALSKRFGIEIVGWTSDQIFEITSLGLDRVCAQGWCVYYRKHCDDGGRHCRVVLSGGVEAPAQTGVIGLVSHTGFEIHAPSRAAMRRIFGALRLQIQDGMGEARATVPLSHFNREAPDNEIPRGCMRSVWVEGCGQPPFPNSQRPAHL